MTRRNDEQELVEEPRGKTLLLRPENVAADDAEIRFVGPDAFFDHARVPDAERHIDAWIAPPEGPDDAREHVDPRRRTGADHEGAALQALQLVDRPACPRDRRRDPRRLLLKQAARLGQRDRPSKPIEQPDAELTFQLQHVLGEGRLTHVKRLASPREILRARRGKEGLELAERHRLLLITVILNIYFILWYRIRYLHG